MRSGPMHKLTTAKIINCYIITLQDSWSYVEDQAHSQMYMFFNDVILSKHAGK